jgi:hypothetical protein
MFSEMNGSRYVALFSNRKPPLVTFSVVAQQINLTLVRPDFEVSARRLLTLIEHGLGIEDLFVDSCCSFIGFDP